jgi:predicted DNA-binding protein YlxM (UPF0122 family)
MTDNIKDLKFCRLLDFYAPVLNEKQARIMSYYYNDDFSLGEIAQHEDISRQGVYDSIKRAETMLLDFEERLQLLVKADRYFALCDRVKELCEGVRDEIKARGSYSAVMTLVDEIGEDVLNADIF